MTQEVHFETESLERLLNRIGDAVEVLEAVSPVVVDAEAGRGRASNLEKAASRGRRCTLPSWPFSSPASFTSASGS